MPNGGFGTNKRREKRGAQGACECEAGDFAFKMRRGDFYILLCVFFSRACSR